MLTGAKFRTITSFPAIFILIVSMLVTFECSAAALGDEVVLSQLGDPVEVEIAVLQWEDIDLEQLQISAGTQQVYESFGLDYLPALEALRFNLVGPDLNGNVKVLVSSRDPMVEPYLELLLVMRWPGGSLLREYVLLFDPPRTTPTIPPNLAPPATPISQAPTITEPAVTPPQEATSVEQDAAPLPAVTADAGNQRDLNTTADVQSPEPQIAEPVPAERAPQTPAVSEPETVVRETVTVREVVAEPIVDTTTDDIEADVEISAAEPDESSTLSMVVQDQRTYTVQSGDNLWDIATKYGPVGANANLYQILLSLYELNRDSFINGNISLLKYGVTLQLPATADVASINAETAQSLFEQRWSEGSERIGMAQRGEPLPPLSSIFAPEVVKPEINPTAGLQEAPEEPFIEQNNGGLLITSSNAPVIPNQAITPAQIQAGSTLSGQAGVSSASNTVGTNVPATGTAGPNTLTVTSTNPYLEGVNTSAQVMQDMLAERQQQVAMLEAQMDEMSTRMLEISRVTERLNTSLEEAIAERDSQQENILRSNLLMGGLVLALSAALVVIVVMILKLAAQLRVQHELLQNSMRVQPPAAPKVSRFTDRPGQTKNAAEKTGVEKFRKHISPEQAALAVPIIEDEEESEERTESANSKDKDQQIAPSSVKQEQTDVELGDMELDPTEENEVPRSR